MKIEKIIVRKDKSKVKIDVAVSIDPFNGFGYTVTVWVCPPKKRTYIAVVDRDSHSFRALRCIDRKYYIDQKQLEVVSKEEILQAKLELWEKIKPVISPEGDKTKEGE